MFDFSTEIKNVNVKIRILIQKKVTKGKKIYGSILLREKEPSLQCLQYYSLTSVYSVSVMSDKFDIWRKEFKFGGKLHGFFYIKDNATLE